MAPGQEGPDGLTFVLDGPRGVEFVPTSCPSAMPRSFAPRPGPRIVGRGPRRRCARWPHSSLAAVGPEPRAARRPRSRRSTARRRSHDHVARARAAAGRARFRARARPERARGRPRRRGARRAAAGRGDRRERRRPVALRLVAPRRIGGVRRVGRRAPPVASRRPGAVPPHVGHRAGRGRLDRRIRGVRLRAGGRRRRRDCVNEERPRGRLAEPGVGALDELGGHSADGPAPRAPRCASGSASSGSDAMLVTSSPTSAT